MRSLTTNIALLITASCTATPAPPPVAAPRVESAPVAQRAAAPEPTPARWSNIETVENCFYFSGPFNGREEQLHGPAAIVAGDGDVRLHLGPAVFAGTLDGETLTVSRTMPREFEGAWTVTETITGTLREGTLRAQYRYEECGPNQPCPGRCTMTADLVALVRPH